MNYKTITIEKNNDEKEHNKYIEFENAAKDWGIDLKQNAMIMSLVCLLLYHIPNYIGRKINVLESLLKLIMSISSGLTLSLIYALFNYFVFRPDYWDALDSINYKKELPKNLSKKTHKKVVRKTCKSLGIAEDENELVNKLNDYKILYQFLRLKQDLIFKYKKAIGAFDEYELIDATMYNVYIDGELLTIENMNMIDINDLGIDCLTNKKNEVKENVKLAEDVMSLEGPNQRKNYEIHKLISLLTIKKEALLEASKQTTYEEEYQKLVKEYRDLSEISSNPDAVIIKVKSQF